MAWHKPLAAITRALLLDMRDAVASEYGPSAGNCFVQVAGAAFSWARERGKTEHSPLDRVKRIPTGNFPAWSNEQVAVALKAFPEALRRAVILGLYTGQRRSDLVTMRWNAYADGVIKVKQIKTDVELVVPVHSVLRAELERWWQERPGIGGATILTSPRGMAWSGTWLSTSFADAVRNAGLPARLNVHGLRKLAAANLAEAGCSVKQIASITGHSTLSMIELYTKSADQRRLAAQAIAKLETGRSETA
jgi:integrase